MGLGRVYLPARLGTARVPDAAAGALQQLLKLRNIELPRPDLNYTGRATGWSWFGVTIVFPNSIAGFSLASPVNSIYTLRSGEGAVFNIHKVLFYHKSQTRDIAQLIVT